jgi:hypothetical protein
MQLIFEGSRGRWEAITKYGEPAMGLPKAAGFKWDSGVVRWHSLDALAALKLREFADEPTQSKLDEVAAVAQQIADAKAKAAAEAVIASRATDSAITIPVPDGLTNLPFQRAGIAYAIKRRTPWSPQRWPTPRSGRWKPRGSPSSALSKKPGVPNMQPAAPRTGRL